jgi:putative peptide zinc metalloprotease protein
VPPPPLGGAEPVPAATLRGGELGVVAGDLDPFAGVPAPARAAGVERFGEVPGSGYLRAPALVRRIDEQVVQLTPMLDAVLAELDGQRSYGEVAAAVTRRTGQAFAAEDVAFLCEEKLRPLGLLRGRDGSEPETRKANPLLALRCRLVVSDPRATRRITAPFAVLFHPIAVVVVTVLFALTTGWLLFEHGLATATSSAFSEPLLLLSVFALTVLSAGFHEFGHAAACRYGGATPGAMGVGLYLLWPAFYTDVSDSYRLDRRGRLRVDLGGLYFNAVFSVATVAVWAATGTEALLLLVVSQLLQMVRQLVPLVRFDGYHILADLVGVPDLFAHIGPTLRGLLPARWRPAEAPALRPWARRVIRLWVAVVVPVLAVVLVLLVVALPRVAATAWQSLQLQWQVLGANWAERAWAEVGVTWLSITALLVPVLSAVYLLTRIVRRAVRRVAAVTAGSRGRRVAAWGLAGALSTAVAVAWWQPGGFAPVAPVEGSGRVQDAIPFVAAADEDDDEVAVEAAAATAPPAAAAPAAAAAGAATTAHGAPGATAPGRAGTEPASTEPVGPPQPRSTVERVASSPAPAAAQDPGRARGSAPTPRDPWPFPWDAPPPVRSGDDRAMVVNLRDGSQQRDVSLSYRWVEDGGPVLTRNEAYAYAECVDCSSLAAAFQVVFVVGRVNIVAPVNLAVAANHACERCRTHAIADQLVVTLVERPDGRVRGELNRALGDLRATTARARTTGELQEAFRATRARVLSILGDAVPTSVSEERDEDRADADDDVAVGDGGAVEDDDVAPPDGDDPAGEPGDGGVAEDEVAGTGTGGSPGDGPDGGSDPGDDPDGGSDPGDDPEHPAPPTDEPADPDPSEADPSEEDGTPADEEGAPAPSADATTREGDEHEVAEPPAGAGA